MASSFYLSDSLYNMVALDLTEDPCLLSHILDHPFVHLAALEAFASEQLAVRAPLAAEDF